MTNTTQTDLAVGLIRCLEGRRKELGMSRPVVARRAGLGGRTVQRVLSAQEPSPNLGTVLLIASALGVELRPTPTATPHQFRREQAEKKATQLAAMVQGTSSLEAQAVSKRDLREIKDAIASELISGSQRRLWG